MINKEYEKLTELVAKKVNAGKWTKEEANKFLDQIKNIYTCINCKWNNGASNSACWSCDD